MKLAEFAKERKQAIIDGMIAHKKKTYFPTWASEVRKGGISVSEMSSEQLYRKYLDETKQVWQALGAMYGELDIGVIVKEAKNCGSLDLKESNVIDMNGHKKDISMER